ncbi:carbohydrate ABC transporter substrate-binding protein, CUT1 family [Tistlia consotensis]|uniref:Carbohydrate ABC transporter substrate-binding protein, CUT1 family n=1 Tax=Tistlia consotensis USBA 355 TaxID=560819 RepID=A0A1Y6CWH9_9PROT|nr:extracellular solute-binding protein [Tistlia consotensis]SMF83608.1 carbohydrate ABC transporter substrate-binding protein, CUT1 family [Tistlia consotensis USBA 355]SNS33352.1 carbohydrate ABC transporter substrate-binding protein, CUT1 family [Tistlia consotensis]
MKFTRRDVLQTGAGLAAGAVGSRLIGSGSAFADDMMSFKPEKGAKLRLLRWRRFVQGDETAWVANTKKFTEKTGVEVEINSESWEDVRPKAAVAANVGDGPDVILGWFDDPHQYPDKLVPLTDLAEYLGKKYGGWYPVCERYGKRGDEWIGLPLGAAGACTVYRQSWVQDAGFETFPTDTEGFLKCAKALKAKGHPIGMALGNAVGDGNSWLHTILWGFGGKMVDDKNKVVMNSPETIQALEYVKELYETFVPGTLSWLDSNNNKAFLAGDVAATINGISIYYAAKTSDDPKMKELAKDIYHVNMPQGPVGKPTELNLFTQAMVFKYSKYPNAAKEYLRFMWEADQYMPWQQAAIGYITQPLRAYEKNPVWTEDPKHTPYRDCVKNMLWNGYSGELGYASAAAMADYIVVNMFAEVCAGDRSPKEAAERAAKRSERYYRV